MESKYRVGLRDEIGLEGGERIDPRLQGGPRPFGGTPRQIQVDAEVARFGIVQALEQGL
jgi:hypothetical protein